MELQWDSGSIALCLQVLCARMYEAFIEKFCERAFWLYGLRASFVINFYGQYAVWSS